MRLLKIAAAAVFAANLLVVLLWLGAGIGAATTVERDTTLAFAGIAALILGGLFAILYFSSRRGSRVGLWICLVLGAAPLILLLQLVAEQHGF